MAPQLEPDTKRVVAFIDGQNLFRSIKAEWGYHFPNYDVVKLTHAIGEKRAGDGWNAPVVRFYTGIPSPVVDKSRSVFWQRKVAAMRSQKVDVFTRTLRYREQNFKCSSCKTEQKITCKTCSAEHPDKGQEKGIDVRIALDMVRLARENSYDVGLVFSQDQDLSEAVDEVKAAAQKDKRWIKLCTVFPRTTRNTRGIIGTEWVVFEKSDYDKCIDPHDYR
jgi:hypothetical protein